MGFLLSAHRVGIPTKWIFALAKGDQTRNRDRIHATLLDQGFAGGLLAQGYGRVDTPRRVDAALKLTVAGLKRIAAAGPLGIPVLNLARSQLKTHLGYPEIADSRPRRLRQLLPAYKFIDRAVLMIGFGTLGSRLAAALHAQGCHISVVDTDPLALIVTAESGYPTFRAVGDNLTRANRLRRSSPSDYRDTKRLAPAGTQQRRSRRTGLGPIVQDGSAASIANGHVLPRGLSILPANTATLAVVPRARR
jgi:hypothetical protein